MKTLHALKKLVAFALLIGPLHLLAIDNPHFWRATNFLTEFYEPRLAKDWLSSFDFALGFGSTHTGRDGEGSKVPLLDIYGLYPMQALGINVPGKDLTRPGDIVLTQLALLPANDGFATLSFGGKFKIIEANFSFSQNITCGFFVQAHLPVRNLQITDIVQTDLSPLDCSNGPNINTPAWQSFLALFPTILAQYDLNINPINHTGVGDLSILGGWTNNYEETQEIDYFDTTIRFGVLFPTGKKKNIDEAFDIANGYDGHFAIPVSLDFAVGWYDWFTLGAHFGAMPFFKKTQEVRLKTDCKQSGFIKLAKARAHVHPGTIWEANAYILADHVACGLSILLGYSFANQNHDQINPVDTTLFNTVLVNSDNEFLGWKMHTINLLADWDFATYEHPWYPHIGGFYNFVVGGRRIFNTNMIGFEFGLNIACDF
jgi:hypothetical protein